MAKRGLFGEVWAFAKALRKWSIVPSTLLVVVSDRFFVSARRLVLARFIATVH